MGALLGLCKIDFKSFISSIHLYAIHLNGHANLSRQGPVPFSTGLRPQPGAEAHGIFSTVRCERPHLLWAGTLTPNICSLTFDNVSQLDQDTSIALAMIREWRNSFIHINLVPLDILALIPTHLTSQKDRLHASFVCRHWRRTFLQRAELWTKLFLSNGEVYVKTFLHRAKESELDVIVDRGVPVSTMALLSPGIRRTRSLDFFCVDWTNIQKFSQLSSGPLPLLHGLTIDTADVDDLDATAHFPQPLFSDAVNLKVLRFHSRSRRSPSFVRFDFPNLVSFEFSAKPTQGFRASRLLDFLKASPMLRTVVMTITGHISLEDVPPESVVTLPNVENFNLIMSDGGPGFEIAAHISCPSARSTSLIHKNSDCYMVPEQIFPSSDAWNAIVHQYARSPVEEVTLELRITVVIVCKLTFRSTDGTLVELCFKVVDEDDDGFYLPSQELQNQVLTQAARTVQSHPQLSNVKRLRICHSFRFICSPEDSHIANEVGRLFKALAPLDELTIYRCDLRPYCRSLFNLREDQTEEPVVFPQTKELTISHPAYTSDEHCKVVVVGLAKSQHARGIPFERVIIRRESMPMGMEESLKPWVGSVEYRYNELCESDDD